MKHYGDITKISGAEVPVVDIITGGSPCQDLSVAGKRAGLAGERSGLFMEQMRIVKEMRERDVRDNGRAGFAVRPRYMVWENVPGAFSSGNPKGADFAAVIEEIIKVAEPDANVSVCVPNGGWTKSGCYYAEDGSWSIAWRVHDAQFWGVPQRRKRIALVADFGGLSAPDILFERRGLSAVHEPVSPQRKGLSGNTEPGAAARKRTAEATESRIGAETARTLDLNGGSPACNQGGVAIVQGSYVPDVAHALSARHDGSPKPDKGNGANIVCAGFKHKASGMARGISYEEEIAPTLIAGQESAVYYARGNGDGVTVPTLTGDHGSRVTDYTALCIEKGQLNQVSMAEQANTLDTMHDQQAVLTFDKEMYNCGEKLSGEPQARYDTVAPTVRADSHPSGICQSVVRRLTPLECERLQGYPDGWTDIGEWVDSKGKKHRPADSPRYKALGNSIALPFWQYLARRICAQYERNITMASLFDGIGGFPLVFQRSGAVPVWASEIEEFPIAVTKKHFPEE